MAGDRRTTETHGIAQDDASPNYESARGEVIREYNTLLVDARRRLRAVLERVEQEQSVAEAGCTHELTWKLRELIEYLREAGL